MDKGIPAVKLYNRKADRELGLGTWLCGRAFHAAPLVHTVLAHLTKCPGCLSSPSRDLGGRGKRIRSSRSFLLGYTVNMRPV